MSDEPSEDILLEPFELSLARVELQAGDKLVVMTDEDLTPFRWQRLEQRVAEFFPGHPVLILHAGARLGIVGGKSNG